MMRRTTGKGHKKVADLPLSPAGSPRSCLALSLGALDIQETIQHDDIHAGNLYARGKRLRVLDWGDASISHPFGSLVVTFRFLEEINRLAPDDPWFARLPDAYLEHRAAA